ncbi:MAG: VanZ family protein [Acidobacteria bacterium]|nr:VanZ family protein [Acidobacteriota bacterium]
MTSAILLLWGLTIVAVVVGSLLPAASPVIVQVAHLHLGDKLLHAAAYTLLAFLPAVGFRSRRTGLLAGLSAILLGILLELLQPLSPGRATELGDALANTAGVATGLLAALPLRALRVLKPSASNPP